MTRPELNKPVAIIAGVWWLMETAYFGWNASPQSLAELVADGVALVLLAYAYACGPRTTVTIHNVVHKPEGQG